MRPDLDIVAELVGNGVNVLDLGCGDGALLEHLIEYQDCQGLGVELDDDDFHGCIARGVPVTHGDLEDELPRFADNAFDVTVLSLTLQSTSRPVEVLNEMNRVADLMVVSLPNVGHWRRRAKLALRGRVPSVDASDEKWYETEKVHACSILDFEELVSHLGLKIRKRVLIDAEGRSAAWIKSRMANLLAEGAVYVLSD